MADAAALKAQANAAFSAKDFEKASELYTKAIEADPTNHVLFSNRSASKSSLKDYQGALEDAEKAIELDKSFVKGYVRKGAALHGLKKYEEAVFAYEEGLQVDPTNTALSKGLSDVKSILDRQGPPDPTNGLGKMFSDPNMLGKLATNPKTKEFMKDQTFVEKLKALQGGQTDVSSMLQDPRMMTVLGVLMGIDLQAFERPEGSDAVPPGFNMPKDADGDVNMDAPSSSKSATVEDHEEVPRSSTKSASKPTPAATSAPEPVEETEDEIAKKKALALKSEGSEAYKKRDFEGAIQKFKEAWEVWQGDVTFLTNLAAVYFETENWTSCIETCEKAVEEGRSLRTDYKIIAKALGRIGSAYEKQGDLTNAVKYYSKSLTEHRTPDVLKKLQQAEKAKKEAEIQAYIDPELAEKAREEGNASFKAASFADAVKHYTEAIKRLPTDPRGYNNRAAAYTKLAALPEALKDAEKAIEIDPKFVKAYIRKSMVLMGMKEPSKAMEACQAATDADVEKKHTREIEGQMQKAITEMYNQRAGETEEQTLERAMRDPEIQEIMSDPVMNSILQQAQQNPRALNDHMSKSPMIKAKIQKLIAAGIIKTR